MKHPYTPIEMAPDDQEMDFPLIEWAVDSYRKGELVGMELRHFILKGLRLKFVGDTVLLGSYCGEPVEEDK